MKITKQVEGLIGGESLEDKSKETLKSVKKVFTLEELKEIEAGIHSLLKPINEGIKKQMAKRVSANEA